MLQERSLKSEGAGGLELRSVVSFAGMTLDKCFVLRIGTLTAGMFPCAGKVTPVQVKEPYDNLDMVTCRFSSCNPECTKYTCR